MDEVRRAYGDLATQYIERFGSTSEVHQDDRALIERHLAVGSGPVLDVGCGPGHLTAFLRSLEVEATGIDLVPGFISHASATYPEGRYAIGSTRWLPILDRSVAGILAWYSLIHLSPDDLDRVLDELRRVMVPAGTLVVGFFDGEDVSAFDHRVLTAYRWPVDELSARLRRAGFAEIERQQRPGRPEPGRRPHAAIAAIAG